MHRHTTDAAEPKKVTMCKARDDGDADDARRAYASRRAFERFLYRALLNARVRKLPSRKPPPPPGPLSFLSAHTLRLMMTTSRTVSQPSQHARHDDDDGARQRQRLRDAIRRQRRPPSVHARHRFRSNGSHNMLSFSVAVEA